jgi:uncharacterized membrane protein YfcA
LVASDFNLGAWQLAVLVLAGAGAGFFNTLASSGSAITLPLLVALGVPAPVANGTNRLSVLFGAASALVKFHRERVIDWRNGVKLTVAAAAGTAVGAWIASIVGAQTLTWVIAGAVLAALALLLARPSRWLKPGDPDAPVRTGPLQLGLLFLVGIWAGFIVLDSATYLLFALVLGVGYDLVRANAIKSLILFVSSVIAVAIFIAEDEIDWSAGAALAVGSVIGAQVGARIAVSPRAGVWIFRLLLLVIGGEAVQVVFRVLHE